MRIHSDTLGYLDLRIAAERANVHMFEGEEHGSRKRARAFEVSLSGSSKYAAQRDTSYKAATWDEWGIFLDTLYQDDPQMIAGQYKSRHDFIAQTQDAVERNENYERLVGRKRPGITGPWLTEEPVVSFGTLHPDGSTSNVRTLPQAAMLACPHFIMVPDHYRGDGTCRCDDPSATEMSEWGYTWRESQWA